MTKGGGMSAMTDEDLESARATAALDARHDPEARERLEDLELEIARRRVADDREDVAAREEERREAEAAERERQDEQERKELAVDEARADLARKTAEFEIALASLVDASRSVSAAIGTLSSRRHVAYGELPVSGYTLARVGERVRAALAEAGVLGVGQVVPQFKETGLGQLV